MLADGYLSKFPNARPSDEYKAQLVKWFAKNRRAMTVLAIKHAMKAYPDRLASIPQLNILLSEQLKAEAERQQDFERQKAIAEFTTREGMERQFDQDVWRITKHACTVIAHSVPRGGREKVIDEYCLRELRGLLPKYPAHIDLTEMIAKYDIQIKARISSGYY
jgi:hypothetical protein